MAVRLKFIGFSSSFASDELVSFEIWLSSNIKFWDVSVVDEVSITLLGFFVELAKILIKHIKIIIINKNAINSSIFLICLSFKFILFLFLWFLLSFTSPLITKNYHKKVKFSSKNWNIKNKMIY